MRVQPLPTLASARSAWEALEEHAGRVYSTWTWADAWWRAHGNDDRELFLHAVSDGDRVAAILPLYRRRKGPARVLRLLGHGTGDELGAVCAASDVPLAAAALRSVAAPRDLLLVDRLRGDDPLLSALGGTTVRTEASPVLMRDGRDWEAWLASRSSNLRQQLRRRERRLVRDHGLRFRLSDDSDRLDDDLSLLFSLHRARWAQGDSVAFEDAREAFHRDVARRALEKGWLRLWIAEADERPVAAWYGFRFGGSEWYYQAGRDPEWDSTAVGMVLLGHSIRAALDDGVEAYRFGVGDEEYKGRFSSSDPTLQSVVVGSAVKQRAAALAAHAVTRMPARTRHRLVRNAN
jgi:CelD/BcsL family acetyltransferase involved in cellulose biosynthesis